MRLILAAAAASAMITSGLAATPASADTLAPVGAVTVTPTTGNDGTAYVDVSWASEPSDADGALVCLHRGINTIATPDNCESQIAVESPALRSGLITVHPGKNYVVEVFSYQTTSPIKYSAPVSALRHGIKLGMSSRCGAQTVGSTCRVIGTVTDAYTGATLANRRIQLWMSREQQPARWSLVATKTTASDGKAHTTITLDRTHLYQWHYGSPHARELSSSSSRVDIVVVKG
jgi:hypothetical protein